MRDLILYCGDSLSVKLISDLLSDTWPVHYSAEHDQLDVLLPGRTDVDRSETALLVYALSQDDLPPTMLEDDERTLILRTVGEAWNPIMVQYTDPGVAKQIVSRIATEFEVVIDLDHGDLIPGAQWQDALAAHPDWDLHQPLD